MVKRYLEAIEQGTAVRDGLATFFAEDVVMEEFPNHIVPNGVPRALVALLEAANRGQSAMAAQQYDIQNMMASGNTVVVEAIWTGIFSVPVGTLPAGGQMRARFAVFIEFRNGKIARQRNYDCYDPW